MSQQPDPNVPGDSYPNAQDDPWFHLIEDAADMVAEQLPDSLKWFEAQEAEWEFRKNPVVSVARKLSELKRREPPEWFSRDMEYQYRKGFYHAIAEASELINSLYRRGGYVRPTEIANILYNWTATTLWRWKMNSLTENPLQEWGTPSLKWKPWPEIRKEVIARDGHTCAECGSVDKLEVHHIEPVCEGGLPEMSNLMTLCAACHDAK